MLSISWFWLSLLTAMIGGLITALIGNKFLGISPLLILAINAILTMPIYVSLAVYKSGLVNFAKIFELSTWPWVVVLALAYIAYNYSFYMALQTGPATYVSTMQLLSPMFVAGFVWLLTSKIEITPVMLVAWTLIAVGAFLLYWNKSS